MIGKNGGQFFSSIGTPAALSKRQKNAADDQLKPTDNSKSQKAQSSN